MADLEPGTPFRIDSQRGTVDAVLGRAARVRLHVNGRQPLAIWSASVRVIVFEDPPPEKSELWEFRGVAFGGFQGWVSSKGRTAVLKVGERPGPTIYAWND